MLSAGGYHSCLDIQQRAGSRDDGEYQMVVGGKNVSIYCHMMNTSWPREYLTLPMAEEQNYSEVYGMRLTSPDSCPNNGSRENCLCVKDDTPRAGMTVWEKINLNITVLTVNCKHQEIILENRILHYYI